MSRRPNQGRYASVPARLYFASYHDSEDEASPEDSTRSLSEQSSNNRLTDLSSLDGVGILSSSSLANSSDADEMDVSSDENDESRQGHWGTEILQRRLSAALSRRVLTTGFFDPTEFLNYSSPEEESTEEKSGSDTSSSYGSLYFHESDASSSGPNNNSAPDPSEMSATLEDGNASDSSGSSSQLSANTRWTRKNHRKGRMLAKSLIQKAQDNKKRKRWGLRKLIPSILVPSRYSSPRAKNNHSGVSSRNAVSGFEKWEGKLGKPSLADDTSHSSEDDLEEPAVDFRRYPNLDTAWETRTKSSDLVKELGLDGVGLDCLRALEQQAGLVDIDPVGYETEIYIPLMKVFGVWIPHYEDYVIRTVHRFFLQLTATHEK